MKMLKLITAIALSLAAAHVTQAQQQEEKTVKPLPATAAKPASPDKPSAEPVAKQIATDAVPAVPTPSNTVVKPEDMKGIEINPEDKKGQEVKNIDRPKTSTIEPAKKEEPAAKPKPKVAIAPEN